jgi:hypothetical protein
MMFKGLQLRLFLRNIILIGMVLSGYALMGQPEPPGPPPANPVPIQGLPFLIGAGLLYGAFKTWRGNSKSKN